MGQCPAGFLQVSNLAVPDNTLSAYAHVSFFVCIRSVFFNLWMAPTSLAHVMEIHRGMSLCSADAQPKSTLQGFLPCVPPHAAASQCSGSETMAKFMQQKQIPLHKYQMWISALSFLELQVSSHCVSLPTNISIALSTSGALKNTQNCLSLESH